MLVRGVSLRTCGTISRLGRPGMARSSTSMSGLCPRTWRAAESASPVGPPWRRLVNRVSVEASFFKKMSAGENLHYAARYYGMGPRDIVPNINFFMNVPVTSGGDLQFDDGLSAPGRYVEITASRDILVLISNCPQVNNPCNGWNPTPVQLLGWW